jgi:hypothetical protein
MVKRIKRDEEGVWFVKKGVWISAPNFKLQLQM